jgi:tetratricopeptide (TPR) repeat protein
MDDAQIERLIGVADDMRSRHQWAGAIDTLRRVLSVEPTHARAHAGLALALVGARRLQGAALEVGIALGEDGNDPFCHLAAAVVRRSERKLEDAWQHCLVALEQEDDVHALVIGASVQSMRGLPDEARELLGRALERAPEHADALRELARLDLAAGRLDDASRTIDAALRAAPEEIDSHVVAGYIALARGDLAGADHHLKIALTSDAADPDVLGLLAASKARRSRLLGMWWRWNTWMSLRGTGGQIGLLIGTFVLARLAIIIAGALGAEGLERVLTYAWLGFCAYTWMGPTLLRRMIARELETVRLRDDY